MMYSSEKFLRSVADGYLVSAEFHESKALSAAALGDDMSAAEDRAPRLPVSQEGL